MMRHTIGSPLRLRSFAAVMNATTAGVLFALCALAFEVGAVGFRLPNQDPEAIARGNAFAATADNASAIYYNPAGITQLEGVNLRAGIYLVSGGVEYTSPTGEKAKVDDAFQP